MNGACLLFQVQRYIEKFIKLLSDGIFKNQDIEFKTQIYKILREVGRHERILLRQIAQKDYVVYFLKHIDGKLNYNIII
jgi:hypothetical protein